jgi:hypothetical protein
MVREGWWWTSAKWRVKVSLGFIDGLLAMKPKRLP